MRGTAVRVERIARYPVKGMAGVPATDVVLDCERGMPFDRELAVAFGGATVEPDGRWTDSDAFHRLLVDADLAGFRVELAEGDEAGATLVITGPDGRRLRLGLGTRRRAADLLEGNEYLREWFTDAPPPRWCAPGVGLWDHRDAMISIIDLDTLEALGAVAGTELDPRRFRANLYVRGLGAGRETSLVGRRLRIGGAELEVLRPIDRCRATTVNPDTATRDVNVPSLLVRNVGHIFCGVYARVVRTGRVRAGDEVTALNEADEQVLREALAWHYARPVAEWPRPMVVTSTQVESDDVLTVWLQDPLRRLDSIAPPYVAGQHLRLHLNHPGLLTWRCYTISGVDGDRYRVTVRRTADGWISHLMHQLSAGDELMVSGPSGEVTLPPGDGPVLFVTAGVGITPAAAMLRQLAAGGSRRPVRLLHVTRSAHDLPLWADVRAAAAALPDVSVRLHLTRDGGPPDPAVLPAGTRVQNGRPDEDVVAAWAEQVDVSTAEVIVCGPEDFRTTTRAGLARAGIDDERVHAEIFYSPRPGSADTAKAPEPGPFTVTHRRGSFVWTEQDGSLLDAAESAGLTLPSSCRAGVCRTCAQRVVGATAYLDEPAQEPPDGEVLICSAVPTQDIRLEA